MGVFTEEEKKHIVDQWNSLIPTKESKLEVGKLLFRKLFEANPDYVDLFRHFKGKSLDEIMASPKMSAHAVRFTSALNGIIESLDDEGCLVAVINDLADSHKERNVLPIHINTTFSLMKGVLLDALGSTADVVAWNKFFKTADDLMCSAY